MQNNKPNINDYIEYEKALTTRKLMSESVANYN